MERRRRQRPRSAAGATSATTSTRPATSTTPTRPRRRGRGHRRRVRDLLQQLGRRHLEPHVRAQHERLGLLHRRLPAAVQPGRRPRLGASTARSGTRARTPAAALVVENSQFDNNEDGFDTNSQNGDEPPPQNGACPGNAISPITHTHSCWVFMDNDVHDNNNPNVPAAGSAAAGPVGTGMSISGGRNDTVMDNTVRQQRRLGHDHRPVSRQRAAVHRRRHQLPRGHLPVRRVGRRGDQQHATSTTATSGIPTNGDFEQVNLLDGEPTDCFSGNTVVGGSTQRRRGRPAGRLPDVQRQDGRRPTVAT